MKLRILIFLPFCIYAFTALASFLFFAPQALAQEEFTTDFETVYELRDDGSARVRQDVALTNNFSTIYASSYTVALEGLLPTNIRVFQNDENIPFSIESEGKLVRISIDFPDAVVGKDKQREFSLEYDIASFASKNGEVWEFSMPRLAEPASINSYRLSIRVPKSFGGLAYISPQPESRGQTNDFLVFSFSKDQFVNAGVVAAFGEFQVFDFNLKYHLLNPSGRSVETEIALVPDTAFQRVYYTDIHPRPQSIHLDDDGNWIATYRLTGRQLVDVEVSGSAQLFATAQVNYPKILPSSRPYYLLGSSYWQVEDARVFGLARQLQTPRRIYQHIVDTLSYDYTRVREGVERLGAVGAILAPERAICMEFTDLFVAVARAAGIPAREVNGFAYTESPEIQPLSLVADVLHSWPEYWDSDAQIWRPADPTWGNTTGGVDYFDKFDLSHIVFAIHGKDAEMPLPAGSYKLAQSAEKDVRVDFGRLPEKRSADFKITIQEVGIPVPFVHSRLAIVVENVGTAASYNTPVSISGAGVFLAKNELPAIDFLAPFDKQEFTIGFRDSLFSWGKDKKILVSAGEGVFLSSAEYIVPYDAQLLNMAVVFIILLAFAFLAFYLLRKKQKSTL